MKILSHGTVEVRRELAGVFAVSGFSRRRKEFGRSPD